MINRLRMRNSINVIVFFLLLSGCTNAGSNNESATSEQSRQDTTFLAKQQIESKQKIQESYDNKISIDTVMMIESESFNVHLEYYCLKKDALVIPSSYYELGGDFKTYHFVSKFELRNQNEVLHSELIDKSTFEALLSDELKNYGVLMFPSVKVSDDGGSIRVHHSVTIPGTDIGTSATLNFDKLGEKRISQY